MIITSVYETVLYGEDLDAMHAFYAGVLGLRHVGEGSERGRAFRVGPSGPASHVLLIFRASHTRRPHETVPSHGADGAGHVALRVGGGTLAAWRERLPSAGFPIEREVAWPIGGRSIYVRDPAGNSVELVEGEVWPG